MTQLSQNYSRWSRIIHHWSINMIGWWFFIPTNQLIINWGCVSPCFPHCKIHSDCGSTGLSLWLRTNAASTPLRQGDRTGPVFLLGWPVGSLCQRRAKTSSDQKWWDVSSVYLCLLTEHSIAVDFMDWGWRDPSQDMASSASHPALLCFCRWWSCSPRCPAKKWPQSLQCNWPATVSSTKINVWWSQGMFLHGYSIEPCSPFFIISINKWINISINNRWNMIKTIDKHMTKTMTKTMIKPW